MGEGELVLLVFVLVGVLIGNLIGPLVYYALFDVYGRYRGPFSGR